MMRLIDLHSKEDLIESMKIICLKGFYFIQTKDSFKLNKICLIQITTIKSLHSYKVKDIIYLIKGRNLFDLNKFLFDLKILYFNQTNSI